MLGKGLRSASATSGMAVGEAFVMLRMTLLQQMARFGIQCHEFSIIVWPSEDLVLNV